jgi:hypothetical protein
MINYGFTDKLEESNNNLIEREMNAIKIFFPNAYKIETIKDVNTDRKGCDVIAHYTNGNKWLIERKMRVKGCSRFWKSGIPDLAPEIWSVVPEKGRDGVVGWTLDKSKITEWVVCTYHPKDTMKCFCINFYEYRDFFTSNKNKLIREGYRTAYQNSGGWKSECIFIPVDVIKCAGIEYYEIEI